MPSLSSSYSGFRWVSRWTSSYSSSGKPDEGFEQVDKHAVVAFVAEEKLEDPVVGRWQYVVAHLASMVSDGVFCKRVPAAVEGRGKRGLLNGKVGALSVRFPRFSHGSRAAVEIRRFPVKPISADIEGFGVDKNTASGMIEISPTTGGNGRIDRNGYG